MREEITSGKTQSQTFNSGPGSRYIASVGLSFSSPDIVISQDSMSFLKDLETLGVLSTTRKKADRTVLCKYNKIIRFFKQFSYRIIIVYKAIKWTYCIIFFQEYKVVQKLYNMEVPQKIGN